MNILNVEKRDAGIKAKKLRREGLVPCTIFGGELKENILITASASEMRKMLNKKSRGAILTLKCGEENYNVILKEISYDGMAGQAQDASFQLLKGDEMITSVAKIVLKNKDKIPTLVQVLIPEIPYRTLPEHLVETVEIDLAKLRPGAGVQVKDLSIYGNENMELLVEAERLVMSIASDSRKPENPVA
jgi:large subunit ribosomal protein L25